MCTLVVAFYPQSDYPLVVTANRDETYMWENPLTRKHLNMLRDRHSVTQHLTVVDPVESNLACGVRGVGAMAPLDFIVQKVKEYSND